MFDNFYYVVERNKTIAAGASLLVLYLSYYLIEVAKVCGFKIIVIFQLIEANNQLILLIDIIVMKPFQIYYIL